MIQPQRILIPLFLLITLTSVGKLFAQDTTKVRTKVREVYFSVSPLSYSSSFQFKKQIGKKIFYKVGLVKLSANSYTSFWAANKPSKTDGYTIGLGIGLEFRKSINDRFLFFNGPGLVLSGNYSKSNYDFAYLREGRDTKTGSLEIPYTLGLLIKLKDNFFLSGEINPGLEFSYSFKNSFNPKDNDSSSHSEKISVDTKSALLSLAYRF